MIEIDIAPAPSSSPSSSTVPQGAADDFAAALEGAGGRESQPRSDRAPESSGRNDASPSDTDAVDTKPVDTEPVERDAPDAVADDDTEKATEPTSEADESEVGDTDDAGDAISAVPLPLDLLALNSAMPAAEAPAMPAAEPVGDEASIESVDVDIDVAETAMAAVTSLDATADGAPATAEILAAGVAATDEIDSNVDEPTPPMVEVAENDGLGAEPPSTTETDGIATTAEGPIDAEASVELAPALASMPEGTTEAADADAAPAAPVQPSTADSSATAASIESEIVSSPLPASTTAAPSTVTAEAAATAASDVAAPTQVSAPAAATTVDPTAAAEVAAAAELDVPTPPQQIAEALRDVRRLADGSHRLSLQLHPEELGVVQLEVAVRDGQLHLRAATELDSTRRLLAASIPELREHLTEAGVSAGSLEVGAETAGGDRSAPEGDAASAAPRGFDETAPSDHNGVADAVSTAAPGRLDVRL